MPQRTALSAPRATGCLLRRYLAHIVFCFLSFFVHISAPCQNRLSRAGFNESLSHESLVSLSDEIAQLSRDIEPLDQQLHYYQQLPPVSSTRTCTNAHVRSAQLDALPSLWLPNPRSVCADSHSSAAVLPFPQDLTLARVRVAEARQQLAELEDQFTQQVQQMHEADGNM